MHGGFYSVKQGSLNGRPKGFPPTTGPRMRCAAGPATAALIFAAMKKLLPAVLITPLPAYARAWPSKPIRWVPPYTGGGLTEVDNRPGANSILDSEIVAKPPLTATRCSP